MQIVLCTTFKPFECAAVAQIQRQSVLNWRRVFGESVPLFSFQEVPLNEPLELTYGACGGVVKGHTFNETITEIMMNYSAEIILYSNADILFADGMENVLRNLPEGDCLVVGQRIDCLSNGSFVLHVPSGMDYFIFKRGMFRDLPALIMGRGGCDSALVAYCLRRGIPVIDASFAMPVVHQRHDYGHVKGGFSEAHYGQEAQANRRLHGQRSFAPHCLDAPLMMLKNGKLVPNYRRSVLRCLEVELYYRRGWRWIPNFNRIWNVLTRGGKCCHNPHWDVEIVDGIQVHVRSGP